MKKQIVLLLLIILFCSCAGIRSGMQKQGGQEVALQNAITDFLTCRLSKNQDVFSIRLVDVNPNLISFAIGSEDDDWKIYITPIDTVGSTRLQIRYIIKGGKLFYWDDPGYRLTKEAVEALDQFDHIDSVNHSDFVALIWGVRYDEKKKGADYHFCKNDLTKYKRVITNRAMEWRGAPKLKCPKSSVGK